MSDPVSAAALIVGLLSGMNSIFNTIHLRRIKCGSCQSECTQRNTPPNSPHPDTPQKKTVSNQDEKDNHSSLSI
jgi:hypothetical protein